MSLSLYLSLALCLSTFLFVTVPLSHLLGFMLLAGRLRSKVEEDVIVEVISKHFKKSVDPATLFTSPGGLATAECLNALIEPLHEGFQHLYWTPGLLRTAVLLYRAIQFDEPTLMIGATGCVHVCVCVCVCVCACVRACMCLYVHVY